MGRMKRSPVRSRIVKTRNTYRPLSVLPMALRRSSASECSTSTLIVWGRANRPSISATDTPCFWHFPRFPSSQSKPATALCMRYECTFAHTTCHGAFQSADRAAACHDGHQPTVIWSAVEKSPGPVSSRNIWLEHPPRRRPAVDHHYGRGPDRGAASARGACCAGESGAERSVIA
jgi:hypothetical protein